jgi:hypothetical protein
MGSTMKCGDNVVLSADPSNDHGAMPFAVTLNADRPKARVLERGFVGVCAALCLHTVSPGNVLAVDAAVERLVSVARLPNGWQ